MRCATPAVSARRPARGFYIYEEGSRTPIPDPEVEALIVAASARLGIKRRTIDKQEIVERLIFPMINEGARILDEGIAVRPGDIDVIWVYGYGWPVWRGGPMFYADQVGLPYVRDQLAAYAARTGDQTLEPAPLLKQARRRGPWVRFAHRRQDGCVNAVSARPFAWERSYPPGVRWDASDQERCDPRPARSRGGALR